jgi:hypothetical protein
MMVYNNVYVRSYPKRPPPVLPEAQCLMTEPPKQDADGAPHQEEEYLEPSNQIAMTPYVNQSGT